jgi:hypothetical protein
MACRVISQVTHTHNDGAVEGLSVDQAVIADSQSDADPQHCTSHSIFPTKGLRWPFLSLLFKVSSVYFGQI